MLVPVVQPVIHLITVHLLTGAEYVDEAEVIAYFEVDVLELVIIGRQDTAALASLQEIYALDLVTLAVDARVF